MINKDIKLLMSVNYTIDYKHVGIITQRIETEMLQIMQEIKT